jgi:hypothetical protein
MKIYKIEGEEIIENSFFIVPNVLKAQIEETRENGYEVIAIGYDETYNLYFNVKKIEEVTEDKE